MKEQPNLIRKLFPLAKYNLQEGQRFGRLRVVAIIGRGNLQGSRKAQPLLVLCDCKCGNPVLLEKGSLIKGRSKSCGCLDREVKTKRWAGNVINLVHGHTSQASDRETPTYRTWRCMKERCFNSQAGNFALYGGRGITVCDRWLNFENFLKDMGERSSGTSIDRINSNGNYEPGNCRWATPKTQRANQRKAA